MYRKNNPWVSLVALLLMLLILVLNCTGCDGVTVEAAAATKPAPRFTVEYAGNGCQIITDNDTGVQYLYYETSGVYEAAGGLCKLEG